MIAKFNTSGPYLTQEWSAVRSAGHLRKNTTQAKKPVAGFHLLVPATSSNENLCKTFLSAIILGYPSPTLVNLNKTFESSNWDGGTHEGKIQGIYNFLSDETQVKDDDLVLIIDGYDVWFQLPPQVLIKRYYGLLEKAQTRLEGRYGLEETPLSPDTTGPSKSKFRQSVVFAADKLCWPNPYEDPACSSTPGSTLAWNAWGPGTDRDEFGFLNRPKFLNSGTIMGPVRDVRLLYESAIQKVRSGRGVIGDQFVFAEIFGEQEYVREASRSKTRGSRARIKDWAVNRLKISKGNGRNPLDATNQTIVPRNMTIQPELNYEFSIGLDYESALFQTMTHSHDDILYLIYSNRSSLLSTYSESQTSPRHDLKLPRDVAQAPPPFSNIAKTTLRDSAISSYKYTKDLDNLPSNHSWFDVRLATNTHVPTVPALLHFNGDKEYLTSWWPRMWYHDHARALLRTWMGRPTGANAISRTTEWDTRGGRGGFWTAEKTYLEWTDLCGGYEDAIFGDGKGPWSKENGPLKIYNDWGKLIAGEDGDD